MVDPTEVWVGGLPRVIGEDELAALEKRLRKAIEFGVKSVRLHSRSNGEGLGYGFVWFSTAEEAERAIRELDGQLELEGGSGKKLRFRAARGHPAQRPGAVQKALAQLSVVCFVARSPRRAEEQQASLTTKSQKWQSLFREFQVQLDLRCFPYDVTGPGHEGNSEMTDSFLSAACGSAQLVVVCTGPRQHEAFNGAFVDRVQKAALSRPETHLMIVEPFLEGGRCVESDADRSAARVTHLRSISKMEEWFPLEIDRPIFETTDITDCLLYTAVRRLVGLHLHKKHKLVVSDCDNTLWAGAAAEEGPTGACVEQEGFRLLQQRLVRLHQAGKVLCLASRNPGEQVVREVFEAHKENMPLKYDEHVAAAWVETEGSKADAIRFLAEEAVGGIAADAIVFLDDNPREVFEVREDRRFTGRNHVLCLQMPDYAADGGREYLRFVQAHWALDVWDDTLRFAVTAEDQSRTQKYRENALRAQFRKRFNAGTGDLREAERAFLASLELKFSVKHGRFSQDFSDDQLERISQLSLRTNQMNTTQLRLANAAAASDWLDSGKGRREIVTLSLSDRFGDYGLVCQGLVQYNWEAGACTEGTLSCFNMSCRVLGRGVERRLIHEILAAPGPNEHRLLLLHVPVVRTPRNGLVRRFVASLFGGSEEGGALSREAFVEQEEAGDVEEAGSVGEALDKATAGGDGVAIEGEDAQPEEVALPDWTALLGRIAAFKRSAIPGG